MVLLKDVKSVIEPPPSEKRVQFNRSSAGLWALDFFQNNPITGIQQGLPKVAEDVWS